MKLNLNVLSSLKLSFSNTSCPRNHQGSLSREFGLKTSKSCWCRHLLRLTKLLQGQRLLVGLIMLRCYRRAVNSVIQLDLFRCQGMMIDHLFIRSSLINFITRMSKRLSVLKLLRLFSTLFYTMFLHCCCLTTRVANEYKKGQLSLINPRDACETFARFM